MINVSIIIHNPCPNSSDYISLDFCHQGFIVFSISKLNDIFL